MLILSLAHFQPQGGQNLLGMGVSNSTFLNFQVIPRCSQAQELVRKVCFSYNRCLVMVLTNITVLVISIDTHISNCCAHSLESSTILYVNCIQ